MAWTDACSPDDIDAEGLIRLDHGARTFAIFRQDENACLCTDGLCSHEEVHLAVGLVMEDTVECPKHASIFDYATGEVETPPACNNLHCNETKVEGGRLLMDI